MVPDILISVSTFIRLVQGHLQHVFLGSNSRNFRCERPAAKFRQ